MAARQIHTSWTQIQQWRHFDVYFLFFFVSLVVKRYGHMANPHFLNTKSNNDDILMCIFCFFLAWLSGTVQSIAWQTRIWSDPLHVEWDAKYYLVSKSVQHHSHCINTVPATPLNKIVKSRFSLANTARYTIQHTTEE